VLVFASGVASAAVGAADLGAGDRGSPGPDAAARLLVLLAGIPTPATLAAVLLSLEHALGLWHVRLTGSDRSFVVDDPHPEAANSGPRQTDRRSVADPDGRWRP
jgi:hypothetical protein